jgi:membrane protease YdiL (CAAX protease family)
MRSFIQRHSLPIFFVVAFVWFWTCLGLGYLPRFRFWASLLGALAPSISALIVAGIALGETGIRELLGRLLHWRIRWYWYLAVIGIPLVEVLFAVVAAYCFGTFKLSRINFEMLRITWPSLWVVFIFAAAEELGWRGFALPRLLYRYPAIPASLILGTIHTIWHWPLILLPHQYMSDVPIIPWTITILAEAIVLTWIFVNTGNSVLMVALFHGMSNITSAFYDGIDKAWMPWFRMSIALVTACIVVSAFGKDLRCKKVADLPSST